MSLCSLCGIVRVALHCTRGTGAGRAWLSLTAGARAPHSLPTKNFLPPLSEQRRPTAGRCYAKRDSEGVNVAVVVFGVLLVVKTLSKGGSDSEDNQR